MLKLLVFLALLYAAYVIARRMLAQPVRVMPKAEAAKLLGLSVDADREAVLDAHRRLIGRVHPDAGGNDELAAQINRARDAMLKP